MHIALPGTILKFRLAPVGSRKSQQLPEPFWIPVDTLQLQGSIRSLRWGLADRVDRALRQDSSIDPLEALRPDPFLGPDEAEAGDAPDVAARTVGVTYQAEAQMRSRLDFPRRARPLRVLAGTGIRLVLQLPLSLTCPLLVVPPHLRAGPTVLSAFFGHLLSLFLSFVEEPKRLFCEHRLFETTIEDFSDESHP